MTTQTAIDHKYYLRIGRADELRDKKERIFYRFFEILPGGLVWLTLGGAILLSWRLPVGVAIFIILFDLYWLLKVVYFSIHTRSAFRKMREYEKIDWRQKLNELPKSITYNPPGSITKSWQDIYHLIILPMYKEPLEVVRPTILALLATDYPKEKMIVVLAAEAAGGQKTKEVAKAIEKEFGDQFFKFLATFHPKGLEGEIPGKGSNEAWAAKLAKKLIIDPLKIPYQNIVVSCFDADTVVRPKYFSCLTYHYLTTQNPTRTSFQPIPLFINNIWEAPAISRVVAFSSTVWHLMNQSRPEKHLTFSSHSMSFQALVDIGFWQTNVVSEDSRIFWQCFLHYDGDYKVDSLYYPVMMDANVAKTFWETMVNIHKQQRRWAYGVADVAYFLFGFWKNKKISWRKKRQYGFPTFCGFYSWATHALLIFILGWLPLFLGGERFNITLLAYNLPRVTRDLLTLAMLGLISSMFLAMILLPPRPIIYGRWKYLIMVLQWLLIPVTLIIFGAIPAIEAQTRLMLGKYLGFWSTPKMRKIISQAQ